MILIAHTHSPNLNQKESYKILKVIFMFQLFNFFEIGTHTTPNTVPTVRGPIVLSPIRADITRGRLFLIPLFWCVKYAETHLIWSTGTLTIEINLVMLLTSGSRPASPTRKLRDRTTLCYAGVHEPAPSHTHLPQIVCGLNQGLGTHF